MTHVKDNRYNMGYSQAEHGNMIVYAPTIEEANALFEQGEYCIEDLNDLEENWSAEERDEYMKRCLWDY